ncbi:MAG: PAS domain-containing protein [Fretibacterium sp.]|nr:PAS domain-containing protein [Fretibacterium sp.]
MQLSTQTQAILDAMSEAILVVGEKEGQIIGCNKAFLLEAKTRAEDLIGTSLIRLSQFTRGVRHELASLYIKALHNRDEGGSFRFRKLFEENEEREYLVSARSVQFPEATGVLFRLLPEPPQSVEPVGLWAGSDEETSGKVFLEMTGEAWMEFRPRERITLKSSSLEDRRDYLRQLGRSFFVYSSSESAKSFYCREPKSPDVLPAPLTEKNFPSFFCQEDDSLRFLDMLASVGQIRANTLLVEGSGKIVEAELSCLASTSEDGELKAIYCISKNHEELKRYKLMLNDTRMEQDFYIHQPFMGQGRLMAVSPIERPSAANVEERLAQLVEQLRIVGANDLLASFYGLSKGSLLMRPMSRLFPEGPYATQILKELFVTRTSSFAEYDLERDELKHLLLFKAFFDNADRLTKILVAASRSGDNFRARHSNRSDALLSSFIA